MDPPIEQLPAVHGDVTGDNVENKGDTENKQTIDHQAGDMDITSTGDSVKIEVDTIPQQEQGTSQKDNDPYAYLQRDEFTSEIFKIEINNLPWRFGVAQLRKKLISLGLKPSKLKVMQSGNFAFVNFKCEEERQQALDKLEGFPWKGKNLKVKKANPAADPLIKKRKNESDAGNGDTQAKVQKSDPETNVSRAERLNAVVSGLWKLPYSQQLETKEKEVHNFIKRLGREIRKNNDDPDMQSYLHDMFRVHKGLCCEVFPIKPSPILDGYRNKCEVTIGQSHDGVDKIVGFRLGSYKEGTICVVEPNECVIMPENMKMCCESLQHFLQTESTRPGFEPESKTGHWTMAVLRTNRHRDTMMIVVFHPQRLTTEEINIEKCKLQEYFIMGKGKEVPLKSLYFSAQSDRRNQMGEPVYEHLTGDLHLEEDLLDMKFRISPGAFFQVNTLAAEVLYSTVGEWCGISANTVLLDICCGTGTIGLTVAKRVKKVVGIEMCKEAVADAKVNAKLNNISNVEYYCAKAETILPSLIGRYSQEDVVAVVDPPRAGLHTDVVRAIRKNEFVQRLVYVSCKPTGALNNLIDFTRSESKRVRGKPFKLVKAVPVDLFPHTSQSELVMLFERPARQIPDKTRANQVPQNSTPDSVIPPCDTTHTAPSPVRVVDAPVALPTDAVLDIVPASSTTKNGDVVTPSDPTDSTPIAQQSEGELTMKEVIGDGQNSVGNSSTQAATP